MFHQEREQIYRAIGDITYAIAVKIITAVVIPVIGIKCVKILTGVGGYIESIGQEIIGLKNIVHAISHNFYRPAILSERIGFHLDTV